MTDTTRSLINVLDQMSKDYARIAQISDSAKERSDASIRARSYNNARSALSREYALRHQPIIGVTKKDVKFRGYTKKIAGVGKAMLEKIEAYLAKGRIAKAQEINQRRLELDQHLLKTESKKDKTIRLFKTVHGIDKQANKLWDEGVRNLGDLKSNPRLLPKASVKYLKYYDNLQKKLKREYIFIFEIVLKLFIQQEFGRGSSVVIAGSYRRGKEVSGDIDVLIGGADYTLKELVNYLRSKNIILEVLSQGPTKALCIAHCPGNFWHPFRMDIHYVADQKEWATALLYFSSGVDFNRWIREMAQRMGLKLSDRGLFRGTKRLETPTEEDIFRQLDLEFIPIEIRN